MGIGAYGGGYSGPRVFKTPSFMPKQDKRFEVKDFLENFRQYMETYTGHTEEKNEFLECMKTLDERQSVFEEVDRAFLDALANASSWDDQDLGEDMLKAWRARLLQAYPHLTGSHQASYEMQCKS